MKTRFYKMIKPLSCVTFKEGQVFMVCGKDTKTIKGEEVSVKLPFKDASLFNEIESPMQHLVGDKVLYENTEKEIIDIDFDKKLYLIKVKKDNIWVEEDSVRDYKVYFYFNDKGTKVQRAIEGIDTEADLFRKNVFNYFASEEIANKRKVKIMAAKKRGRKKVVVVE